MEEKIVELKLGTVCNNYCKFCMSYSARNEMRFIPFDVLRDELKDFYRKGYRTIGFIGGEPTLHPDLIKLIKLASKKGYRTIYLVSNGRKYADRDFLLRLIKAGATKFYVSIHSHKAEIEDYLTSVKGSFKQKMQGLFNLVLLKRKGLIKGNILLNIVINKRNLRYLTEIIFFYRKRFGLTDFRLNFIGSQGNAIRDYRRLVPRYSQLKKYLPDIISVAKLLRVDLAFGDIPFCIMKEINGFQDFVGEFRDGSRKSRSGMENREEFFIVEKRRNELKVKKKICQKCKYSFCEGPWKAYVKIYGFKEFRPVTV